MEQHTIIRLTDRPEYKESMAQWFHEKWGIPKQAYLDSMDACLKGESAVPQWYAVVEDGRIIGGLGVIENDFHDRKDLSPNVCAVYVEEDRRCRGIAGEMLHFVSEDMKGSGVPVLYLVTDHTSFYERYGWRFLCMAQGDGDRSRPDCISMKHKISAAAGFPRQPIYHFACFMERLIRWRFSSTFSTTTFTTSPTLTTSLGWRRRRSQTSEICTRPS